VEPYFVIFGGSAFGGFDLFNDTWRYSLKNNTWFQLDPRALQGKPVGRRMANSIYNGARLFIFSGLYFLI
jgi:hypothetical protein